MPTSRRPEAAGGPDVRGASPGLPGWWASVARRSGKLWSRAVPGLRRKFKRWLGNAADAFVSKLFSVPTFVLWAGTRGWFGRATARGDTGFNARMISLPTAGEDDEGEGRKEDNVAFFLLPHRLRFHFWSAGALLFLPLRHEPLPRLWEGRPSLGPLDSWGVASLGVLLWLGPYLVYGQFRKPALTALGRELPDRYRGWLAPAALGGQQRRPCRRPSLLVARWMVLEPLAHAARRALLPLSRWVALERPLRRYTMPVAFGGRSCRQRLLIKLAMEELFNRPDSQGRPDARLRYWVWYALAPAWLMLAVIMLYVVSEGADQETMLRLAVGWMVFALAFFVPEWRNQLKDFGLSERDLAGLPVQVRRPENRLGQLIGTRQFVFALGVAFTVVATLLLAAAQVLPEACEACEACEAGRAGTSAAGPAAGAGEGRGGCERERAGDGQAARQGQEG